MNDYEPLDITNLFNSGADIYDKREVPPPGKHSFYGLPFILGTPLNKGKICIKLDKKSKPINIKIKESCTLYKLGYDVINSIDDIKNLDKILDKKGVNVVEIKVDFNSTQKIEEAINQKL